MSTSYEVPHYVVSSNNLQEQLKNFNYGKSKIKGTRENSNYKRWTKVALGQVFSEYFGFPCQSTFHLLLHNHFHYHPRLAQ
jgi:hypothetical protein